MAESNVATLRDQRTEKRFFVDNIFVDTYGPIIGPYGHAVYNVLLRHSTPKGTGAFPSHKTIAEKSGCGPTKVKKVLKQFQDLGLIFVVKRFNEETGRQTSNEYLILDPPVVLKTGVVTDTPPRYPADTPPQVPDVPTINPPKDQSTKINPKSQPSVDAFRVAVDGLPEGSADPRNDWDQVTNNFCAFVNIPPYPAGSKKKVQWGAELRSIAEEWEVSQSDINAAMLGFYESGFQWKDGIATPYEVRDQLGVLAVQHRNGGIRMKQKPMSNMEKNVELFSDSEDGAYLEGETIEGKVIEEVYY